MFPSCFSPTSEGKEKKNVWDHLGLICQVALPKNRFRESFWAKKNVRGRSFLRYQPLSADFGIAAEIYTLAWDLLTFQGPA